MMAKDSGYVEIQLPAHDKTEPVKKKLDPSRMRKFMSHLSRAALSYETKMQQRAAIHSKIQTLKSMSLNKRTKKADIESEFGNFQDLVNDVIKDEHKILEEQRKNTQEVSALKKMVEELSAKLVSLGKEYAMELEKKDKKINELREALANARMKLTEMRSEAKAKPADRKARIAEIEKKVKSSTNIKKLENDLKTLEAAHKKLVRSGKHPKKDLDRLKRMIDSHKKKLADLKQR